MSVKASAKSYKNGSTGGEHTSDIKSVGQALTNSTCSHVFLQNLRVCIAGRFVWLS